MTDLLRQIAARKLARRKELAALPVGEKLRMLEKMLAATRVISVTRPPKPANPVRRPEPAIRGHQRRPASAESK